MDRSRTGAIRPESRSHGSAAATGLHLARFALTGLLLPQLLASRDGRVVTISSDLHKRGRIPFDDLTGSRRYGRVAFYAQSKFANVLFALELDRRLKAAGVPVKSVLAQPCYAATNLQLSGPSGILKLLLRFGNRLVAQPAEMGVLPQLYANTAPEVEGELGRRLWQLSEDLTSVCPDFSNTKRIVA